VSYFIVSLRTLPGAGFPAAVLLATTHAAR
jgi:hypothetical protein